MLGAIQRLNFTELILFNVHVNVDNEMVGIEFMLMLGNSIVYRNSKLWKIII